ncbi:uncharacterized protein L201_007082 [Kwoniella dendrophila CBS 6074]|uniref:Uncharacterized protein n=1 Tax=Kwoniella dendrophila CBS 6074 TaxID=1295534 RepID=A0AAX4K5V9_9TREE
MGTRGLLGFIISGKRIGTYNHFDSYPEGLGVAIVRFLLGLTPEQRKVMVTNLNSINWVKRAHDVPKEVIEEYMLKDFHLTPNEKELRSNNPEKFRFNTSLDSYPSDWYTLLRGVQGANCLPHILDGSLKHLIDNTDFEQDGLFCEWSYWINFEEQYLLMNGGKERKWDFNELDKGYWAKLIDDDEQEERKRQGTGKDKGDEQAIHQSVQEAIVQANYILNAMFSGQSAFRYQHA